MVLWAWAAAAPGQDTASSYVKLPALAQLAGYGRECEEVGEGYNSENEHEPAAAQIETVDPATVEQQEHCSIIQQMREDSASPFQVVAEGCA